MRAPCPQDASYLISENYFNLGRSNVDPPVYNSKSVCEASISLPEVH